MNSSVRVLGAVLFVALVVTHLAPFTTAQTSPPAAAPQIDTYPDNAGGLKHLAKDIMKSQKENDLPRAGALLNSLLIPNYQKWYPENFDDGAVARVLPKYEAAEKSLPAQFATFFLRSQMEGMNDVEVVRFENDCDDNASEQTFNTLDARLKPIPLYELRMFKGTRFIRLFAFAYIDGGFRFVLTPDFSDGPLRGNRTEANRVIDTNKVTRLEQTAPVQGARLLNRVQPVYPEVARQERLSGTVRLHAIIGTDGKINELRVITGRCSLAKASVAAVRQWRYSPTLVNGQRVEVDTTIDVIFALNN